MTRRFLQADPDHLCPLSRDLLDLGLFPIRNQRL